MATARRNYRGETTEREILDVTMDMIERFGYERTTIAGVARATKKSPSSVYWLFDTKDELITRALEASYPSSSSASQWDLLLPREPIIQQLERNLLALFADQVRERSVRAGIMLALEGAAAQLPVQEPFRRRQAALLLRLEEWWAEALPRLRDGVPAQGPRRMAQATMWHIDGHFVGDRSLSRKEIPAKVRLAAESLMTWAESSFTEEPTGTPQRMPEAEEDLLLVEVRNLVARHGYEGATIARICKATGMTRSSLYWRYPDKDSLVEAAVSEQFLQALEARLYLPPVKDKNPAEMARVLAGGLARIPGNVAGDRSLMTAGVLLAVQRFEPPTAGGASVVAGTRKHVERLANWFIHVGGLKERGAHDLAWLYSRQQIGIVVGLLLQPENIAINEDSMARVWEKTILEKRAF